MANLNRRLYSHLKGISATNIEKRLQQRKATQAQEAEQRKQYYTQRLQNIRAETEKKQKQAEAQRQYDRTQLGRRQAEQQTYEQKIKERAERRRMTPKYTGMRTMFKYDVDKFRQQERQKQQRQQEINKMMETAHKRQRGEV